MSLKTKILLFVFSVAVLGLTIISFLIPSTEEKTSELQKKSDRPLYPNEWMYNQRAYPDNYINKDAIRNATIQSRAIKASRDSNLNEDWSLVGPLNTGGRVTDIAISPDNNDHFYITTAVGGVFRTTDKGENWEAVFDDIGVPSIGNIAIAPSDAQRIYVGTGEANGSATSGAFLGDGIYRSDDGGDSWTNKGLQNSNHIGRIIVDPANPDRVFVAATGILYGYNDERGIYRSTNGGDAWENVLFVTDSTAAIDIIMNPLDTDILYAAMWERTRKPYQRDYGGVTSGIHKSTDGGDTWELLGPAHGLPAPDEQTGRIGLAISASNPDILYARYTTNQVTNQFDGLYRSLDQGNTWELYAFNELLGVDANFGWYFGNVRVDPENPGEVYVLGQQFQFFNESFGGWDINSDMHVDHHALEFSTSDSDFMLSGNDGGVYLSENGGDSWEKFTNLPITQFYNIEVDFTEPINLFGGTQDNNTIRTSSTTGDQWFAVWGGDGFHVNVDPSDNSFVYAESQFGNLARSTDGGFSFIGALNGINPSDRTNWNTPVILSPFNPEVVYYGSNKLYQSTNRAVNWSAISEDLTDGLHPSGSLSFGTLTAIAASYSNLTTIYTGSDDGNVSVTFDGGTTWENISEGLPDRYITSLAISPTDDQTLYVTLSGFSNLDYTPHVFKTTDGGQTWNDISGSLPSIPANDIILVDVSGQEALLLATDMNVWYSQDDGTNWDILGNDLPFTIIRDLKYHEPTGLLYAGTFGRSIHQYDLSSLVLSVEENSIASSEFSIFPNPVSNTFTLDHNIQGIGSIVIYDTSGREVSILYKGELTKTQNTAFERGNLASGIYIIKVTSSNTTSVSKKLIVQ